MITDSVAARPEYALLSRNLSYNKNSSDLLSLDCCRIGDLNVLLKLDLLVRTSVQLPMLRAADLEA